LAVTRWRNVIAGALNLGGSIEMIPNAVRIAELANRQAGANAPHASIGTTSVEYLPDDLWTKISIEFYKDGPDTVFKAIDD
jgi:ATP-dependent Lon protease